MAVPADRLGEPQNVLHFLLELLNVAHLARKRFNTFTSKWSGVDLFGIVGLLFFALSLAAGWAIVSKLSTVLSTLEASVAAFHLAFGPDGNLYATGPTMSKTWPAR